YYYLLVKGNAKVYRRLTEGQEPTVVAELTEPQGFGEEALISNAKRNATITMITDGTVMRLSKDAFNDFVKEPLLDWYPPVQAQDKIANGAKWIDVRSESQSKHSHLHGALAIPVEEIRAKASALSKDVTYICYCENGRISSSAAFILKQMGYNAGVLRGGLQSLKRAGQN
ncbi:MAG: cyclic nucleotide-binding domain-containing protein, partial [Smithella sp.]|nr:cyclic nucleotide-binding domain-containing protein [Smithella sp.]